MGAVELAVKDRMLTRIKHTINYLLVQYVVIIMFSSFIQIYYFAKDHEISFA